jgi:hypothetical protein
VHPLTALQQLRRGLRAAQQQQGEHRALRRRDLVDVVEAVVIAEGAPSSRCITGSRLVF